MERAITLSVSCSSLTFLKAPRQIKVLKLQALNIL